MGSASFAVANRWGRYGVGLAVAAGLLVVVVPSVSGVAWGDVSAALATVPTQAWLGLVALWFAGLLAHTIALTTALPRLSHRRALTLSLTGSAVANVLPLGGAAGVALNYRMVRDWGFDRAQFAAYTVVTNLWDVLAKGLLPVVVMPVLLLVGLALPGPLLGLTVGAVIGLAVMTALGVASLSSARVADRTGRAVDLVANRILVRMGWDRRVELRTFLVQTQGTCRRVIVDGWARLSLGMVLYTALLYALMWTCLDLTGAALSPATILAGFTAERLLTLATITPGGAGIVEVGLSGILLLLGGDAAGVVSGVLLYRLLSVGLEIPVGGANLGVWLWMRHHRHGRARVAGTVTT